MRKVLFLGLLILMQNICFAQSSQEAIGSTQIFNGDWKGTVVYDTPAGYEVDYIFHIVDNQCSEELTRRSPAEVKEALIKMTITDNQVTLNTRNGGIFTGKLVNGKIVGEYDSGRKIYNMTLSKFGKGVIDAEKNFNIDRKHGIVTY